MSELKITIVTAVYNGEKYIEECIKSIMNQTYQNFEHIIMDGGSTDNTLEIAKKYEKLYNVKIYSRKDNGMYCFYLIHFRSTTTMWVQLPYPLRKT